MALRDVALLKNLIFDLDDTLFDTFGQLVKPAFREASLAMIAAGLEASLEDCLLARDEILSHNRRAPLFAAIAEKFKARGVEEKKIEAIALEGFRSFHKREIKEKISLFDDAASTLTLLQAKYSLFLVTMGNPATQQAKVSRLALAPFFQRVFYVDVNQTKRKIAAFREIREAYGQTPAHFFVSIGNRIDLEIKDAKELGMQTILMERGEHVGLHPQSGEEIPDAIVFNMRELQNLLRVN